MSTVIIRLPPVNFFILERERVIEHGTQEIEMIDGRRQ